MRIFIVGGSPEVRRPAQLAPSPGDRVIAADRGAQHARAWGWPIHLLVGDLDSLPPADQAAAIVDGTPTLQVPAEKDETDMELALCRALAAAPEEIIICGGLGGRTDHLLANVLLLTRPDLAGLSVTLVDGPEAVRLLRGNSTPSGTRLALSGTPGDLVTLLPLGDAAEGISTHGLRYPLNDEMMPPGSTRGVSNVVTAHRAELTLRRGMLLVIQVAAQTDRSISGGRVASGGVL